MSRPAQATASDLDASASGLLDHRHGISGLPDVAVSDDRDVDGLDEVADGLPVGVPGIGLGDGASVQAHRSRPGVDGDAGGVEVGDVVGVDADTGLDGDGDAVGVAGLDGSGDDRGEPVELPGQDSPAALASDLRYRAAEVEIDMVDPVLLTQDRRGLTDHSRVDPVELHGTDVLTVSEGEHVVGLVVTMDQAARSDHLADVEPCSLLGTQLTESGIGDTGHRRQHHRGVHRNGTSRRRGQGQGVGRHSPMVDVAHRLDRNRRARPRGTTGRRKPLRHTIPATSRDGLPTTLML